MRFSLSFCTPSSHGACAAVVLARVACTDSFAPLAKYFVHCRVRVVRPRKSLLQIAIVRKVHVLVSYCTRYLLLYCHHRYMRFSLGKLALGTRANTRLDCYSSAHILYFEVLFYHRPMSFPPGRAIPFYKRHYYHFVLLASLHLWIDKTIETPNIATLNLPWRCSSSPSHSRSPICL